MERVFRIAVLLIILGLSSGVGCMEYKTGNHYLHAYERGSYSRLQVAVLKGSAPIYIYKIDGKKGNRFITDLNVWVYNGDSGGFDLELVPGRHNVVYGYIELLSRQYSVNFTTYQFARYIRTGIIDAKAGCTYLFNYKKDGDRISIYIDERQTGN